MIYDLGGTCTLYWATRYSMIVIALCRKTCCLLLYTYIQYTTSSLLCSVHTHMLSVDPLQGSVQCLQFDEDNIVTGSWDTTCIVSTHMHTHTPHTHTHTLHKHTHTSHIHTPHTCTYTYLTHLTHAQAHAHTSHNSLSSFTLSIQFTCCHKLHSI